MYLHFTVINAMQISCLNTKFILKQNNQMTRLPIAAAAVVLEECSIMDDGFSQFLGNSTFLDNSIPKDIEMKLRKSQSKILSDSRLSKPTKTRFSRWIV